MRCSNVHWTNKQTNTKKNEQKKTKTIELICLLKSFSSNGFQLNAMCVAIIVNIYVIEWVQVLRASTYVCVFASDGQITYVYVCIGIVYTSHSI